MSWIFAGPGAIVFSGKDGQAQYADMWRLCSAAGGAVQLPPIVGSKIENFLWQGFVFRYEPMQ